MPHSGKPPRASDINECRRCDLWRAATQGVPGAGAAHASILLVGEQPGDEEDLQGKPFVGPAGRLLDRAMQEAGVSRASVYVTNAVKHFKFELRGKRRIHKTPAQREIAACRPWLEQEIGAIGPRVIVALGSTALNALVAKPIPIYRARQGGLKHPSGATIIATYHPAAVLRAPEEARATLYAALCEDLRRAAGATVGSAD
jgi:uracil-DNA glycosylase family protein